MTVGDTSPVAWRKVCECADMQIVVCQYGEVSMDLGRMCARVWLGIGSAYGVYGYRVWVILSSMVLITSIFPPSICFVGDMPLALFPGELAPHTLWRSALHRCNLLKQNRPARGPFMLFKGH